MTLPEIVIDEKARRWPLVLLYVVLAIALAPLLLLVYVNLFFAGVFGGPHLFFVVALPFVWLTALVSSIVWSGRRAIAGFAFLGLLVVLAFVDALVLLPVFAP